ncbi:MAG TPA: BREX system ATP-binding domain-containing protein [Methylomirabilota bacterium]|nr:BREX system ATP-binding domain-containing protein [Methylomirabilota bacterium]
MATIAPQRWLNFLQAEYLESFIKDGGASVKFAVPLEEELRGAVEQGVRQRGQQTGFIATRVSSANTRVHMIDQLFFRVAEQVPWRQLSQAVIVKLAREAGYAAPSGESSEPLGHRLAAANSISPETFIGEARPWIENRILKQRSLAKDFRVAVGGICFAELSGGPDGETRIEVVTDWLTGRNKAISAVKPYQIFSRITRSNARHLLESLLLWIRFAGYSGIVIVLDISRVTIARNPRDDLIYYTKAAMLDAYEVLRQFIDSTDRMKGCLLVVTPSQDFLDVEPQGRGMGAYDALKLRVYDEVRDQRLVNPMGALVRVSSDGSVA